MGTSYVPNTAQLFTGGGGLCAFPPPPTSPNTAVADVLLHVLLVFFSKGLFCCPCVFKKILVSNSAVTTCVWLAWQRGFLN